MCGRFVQVWDSALQQFVMVYVPTWKEEDVILRDLQDRMARGYNIGPSRRVASLVHPGALGKKGPDAMGQAGVDHPPGASGNRLELARWGFRIAFKGERGQAVEKEVFNTRVEEALEKPLWRGLLGRSHAVVPAQGFYEWTGPRSDRVPHFIERADGQPMLFAAVTGMRETEAGRREPCVSLLTCGASDWMRPIHDRMPVILEPGRVQDWLEPASIGMEAVLDLCVPTKAPLKERVVSPKVNDVANGGPELLASPRVGQARLF